MSNSTPLTQNTMTTQELRLGNWILPDKASIPMRVVNLGADYLYLDFEGNEGDLWEPDMKKICGIPLTEELLLKCGFEAIPHFTVVNSHTISLGRGRVLSIGNTENANQMAWIESVDGDTVTDLICVHNFDYDGKMHLHQLQNLYFALTGQELEINL